jgi:PAS domain S-box-containing protein
MSKPERDIVHYWITLTLGVIPLLLGLAVLIGWYIENKTLIQVHPSFVPMQYNTALGFFLAAAGFIAVLIDRRRLATWCGGITAAIGLLTIFQYMSGLDLGIDQLLMEHYITVETSHPGRMAPNTALCFSLSGIAILFMNRVQANWIGLSIFGSLITGLGVVAFTGYIIGLESAYGWASLTKMAVHTAVGFILLGLGILSYCGLGSSRDNIKWESWISIPTGILVLTVTACLSQALQATHSFVITQNLMLIFGVVLAAVLGAAVHLAQNARLNAELFETKVDERTQELRGQEQRLNFALRAGKLGTWDLDLKTGINQVDELYARMLDYEPEEFPNTLEMWVKTVHPDDLEYITQSFNDYIRGLLPEYIVQYRAFTKGGNIIWVEARGAVVERDEADKPTRVTGTQADITDRMHAQEEIERQKAIIEKTMENMDQGIVMFDKDLNMLAYNQKYTEVLGIPRDIVEQAKSYIDLIQYTSEHILQDTSRTEQVIQDTYGTDYHTYEISIPNGKVVQVSHCPMQDGGAVRIFSDITERKQAENLVQFRLEMEQIVRAIPERFTIESNLDAGISISLRALGRLTEADRATLWQCNNDGMTWSVTGEWCADGVEPQKSGFQNIPSSELEKNAAWRLLDKGKPSFIPDIYELPPGQSELRDFYEALGIKSIARFPIMEDDKIVAFLNLNEPERLRSLNLSNLNMLNVFGENLHSSLQRRNAEERLRESQQLLEGVIENSGAAIFVKDFEGKYILVNKEVEKSHDKKRDEIIGKTDFELLPKDIAEKVRGNDLSVMNAAKLIRFEESADEGKTIFLSMKFPLFDLEGNVNGICSISTDISEQKKLQVDLESAKLAAESAAESKANFLATMSHEIRTPMNGVIGMVDLLRQTELDSEQKQMLQTVSDSGQSLLIIINDILDFSKIEAGKLDLETIPMSLTEVVEGSCQTIAPNADRKGVRLVAYIDPSLPQFVTGDPVRIRQILINLGGNAIKFTDEANVVLRAERIGDDSDEQIRIRFSVVDQGIGISETAQEKLFEAFSQAETSTTRKYGGTGLGLSICQRLTRMMGGEIGVNSTLGEGSEFYVSIPFKKNDKVLEHSNVSDLKGLRVLLIVNDETEQTILKSYLEYWHAETETINDLDSCLDTCRAAIAADKAFDVVVMGPQWPREQQFPLRDKAAKDESIQHTKFVSLLTGKRRMARLDSPESVCIDVNPLRRAAFLSAVAIAAGRASPEVHYEEEVEDLKAAGKAPTIELAKQLGSLILVAEDNPTNRDVIGRQLNLLGYACEMADDGKLALEAWRNDNYAILLTDCHMPNMDGFELTDAIRKDEQELSSRAPIVAITANALQGEAERCLAAGMDDYMSKPIDMKELREKLRRWMPEPAHEIDLLTGEIKLNIATTGEADNTPIDESTLKSMFGDDPDIFKEILGDFITPSRDIIVEIKNGWESRSAEAIMQAAHKLKSSARSVGANELADLCQALETAGKKIDWEIIDSEALKIDTLMEQVEGYIQAL